MKMLTSTFAFCATARGVRHHQCCCFAHAGDFRTANSSQWNQIQVTFLKVMRTAEQKKEIWALRLAVVHLGRAEGTICASVGVSYKHLQVLVLLPFCITEACNWLLDNGGRKNTPPEGWMLFHLRVGEAVKQWLSADCGRPQVQIWTRPGHTEDAFGTKLVGPHSSSGVNWSVFLATLEDCLLNGHLLKQDAAIVHMLWSTLTQCSYLGPTAKVTRLLY